MWRHFKLWSSQYWQQVLIFPSELLRPRIATALPLGWYSWLAFSWCAVNFFSVALAQPVKVDNRPETKYMDIKGRIHSFDAKRINVVTDDNQAWQVELAENTRVHVTGRAGIELLQPKMAVRFHAEVNDRATTVEPVKKMTVFSPRDFFQPMIEEAGDEGETEKSGDQSARSAEAQNKTNSTRETKIQEDDLPEKLTPAERRRRRRDRSRTKVGKPGTRYYIAGILKGFQPKKNRFIVNVGQAGTVRGSVAADVVVEVDFTSHRFARPGDHILVNVSYIDYGEAAGKQRPPRQVQQGTAREISITLADPDQDQPLPEGLERKSPRKSRR